MSNVSHRSTSVAAESQKGSRNGCNHSPSLNKLQPIFFFNEGVLGVGKDGCGSEFIVGSSENRICMCAHVKFWSRFCAIYFFKYIR